MNKEDDVKETAIEMANLINRNIQDVTKTITLNIDYSKPHTVLSAYAAVYTVAQYFEYKLSQFGISPGAIQTAKQGADKYVVDVISGDLEKFPLDKGDA